LQILCKIVSGVTLGLSFAVFILLFDHMERRRRWKNYPPAPVSFPFVGNLLQIDFHNPHLSFTQVSARGDIWSP
uniref:Cytochrome P450 n=1 Tax=Gopherus evgoodei TaxID=1825980 RepID=A0A8C4VF34_9SAUR